MTATAYCTNHAAYNCTAQCGNSSCEKMYNSVHAAFGAVCAFLLALMAVIIDGAIISVIICVAVICVINVIIITDKSIRAREVYLS